VRELIGALHDRGSTPLTHLPVWVQVIAVVGFPCFVAAVFLAQMVGLLGSPAAESLNLLKAHAGDEKERTSIIRVMCRAQLRTTGGNPDDCEVRSSR